jgi:hypothetical protein
VGTVHIFVKNVIRITLGVSPRIASRYRALATEFVVFGLSVRRRPAPATAIPALTVGKTDLAMAHPCFCIGKECAGIYLRRRCGSPEISQGDALVKQTGTNGVDVPLTTSTVE